MNISSPYFILASASPERLKLLKQIGLSPQEVISTDIDETMQPRENPRTLALRLSKAKALACHANHQHQKGATVILGADTVVSKGRRIVDKATTDADVEQAMQLLSGCNHRVYSSICAIATDSEGNIIQVIHKVSETRVKFKHLSPSNIRNVIATKEGIGKAGGYAINGFAAVFVQSVVGQVSTVLGMPMYQTYNILSSMGIESHGQLLNISTAIDMR